MGESWSVDDGSGTPVTAETVRELLRRRIDSGQLETSLTSSAGRSLVVVTNTERAMVMLLDGAEDAGEHAVDPGAGGSSTGFVLANGQSDEYRDEDTVPLAAAFGIVTHLVRAGSWPTDTRWVSDR